VPEADDAKAPRAGMLYGILNQKNDVYDDSLLQELHDLFEGGYTIAKRASKYIEKLCNEHIKRYRERCRTAAYQPYFGQIVETFASELFAQPVSVIAAANADTPNVPGELPDKKFYTDFETNVNLQDMPFTELMKEIVTYAMVQRTAYVCVDAPKGTDMQPTSRADEDARGLRRLYAYRVPCQEVIDWEDDDTGGYEFLVRKEVTQKRHGPEGNRNLRTESFTVWTMVGDLARYDRYAVTWDTTKPALAPKDEDTVPYVGGGMTAFGRIPILRFILPNGLWVGNKIGPQAKEHWNRRSALIGAEARSLLAIPYIARGSEIGAPGSALPAETQQNPNRGADPVGAFNAEGFVEVGADDTVAFAEPAGSCYELVDKELKDAKDEMFRVNHQMAASVSPTPGALGRSGLSKQKDGEATAKVLRALAAKLKPFAQCVYETVGKARGDETIWTVTGLDHYDVNDREQVLEEAISIDQVSIPSETFKKTHKKQVARKLLTGVDPQTWATIDDEIDEGVESEGELSDIMQDAQKDALLNPQPPTAPKVGAPKSPTAKPPQAPTAKPPGASKAA
jgi:hypothetical protein